MGDWCWCLGSNGQSFYVFNNAICVIFFPIKFEILLDFLGRFSYIVYVIDGEVIVENEELREALRSMIAMDWEQGGREACEALRVRYLSLIHI